MSKTSRGLYSTALHAALMIALYPAASMAQDAPRGPNAEVRKVEEIVVTGSRIRRAEFEAPVPISAVDREDLESSGFTDLTENIADLPGASFGDTVIGTPNGTIQNAGTASINLRNLGSNRTLTLIDGRRTVSNASNRNVVSLNTIPLDFVERVEVITGAASAVYGSDAVAGVVNIITENNLDGFRTKLRGGSTFDGGGDEYSVSATFGKPFAADRGYLLLSASYEEDEGLFASDRGSRAARNWSFDPSDNEITEPDLSSDIPGGRFRGSEFFYNDAGLQRGFVTAQHGYNDRPLDTLRVPRDAFAIAGKLRFEISESFQPFATVMFTDLDTNFSRAPIGARNDTEATVRDPATGLPLLPLVRFTPGRIPRSSALIPAEILPRVQASGLDFRRRFDEIGLREFINDRDTLRVQAGFNGDFLSDWFYEISYSLGDYKQDQVRTGNINLRDLQRGLDVEADPATGQLRCRDAAARAEGCVPVNIFGVGSISPEAADYIRADTFFKSNVEQQVVQAYATGGLLDLPAGRLSLAAGVEYREDSSTLETDDEVRTGYTTASGVPAFDEKITVKEIFAELTIPLLSDKPLVHELAVDIAGRASDYSQRNVGEVFSYRFGLGYSPVEWLRFRAQRGTAQRAPDLAEIYSPPRDDRDNTIDPCNDVTATSTGTLAQNCLAEPGIAAAVAAGGVYEQETDSLNSPNAGNLDLKEETADTLTVGVVLTPLPGFSLSVDYYRIEIEDAIDAYDAEVILDQCYNDPGFPNNAFCPEIVRNAQNGQIQQIIQRQQNLNSTTASGIDVRLDYDFDFDAVPGEFNVSVNWTHEIENETLFTAVGGVLELDDDNGEIDFPQDQVRAQAGYEIGDFSFRWRTRYLGSAVATNERVIRAREDGIGNPLFLKYGDWFRHDIYASFAPQIGGTDVKFYLGVNNIFDDTGPDVPEGATPTAVNGYIPIYGIVGRSGYVGVEMKF